MTLTFLKLTSINSRIILGAIAVVSGFMLLTGFTLSKTFYDSAYSALEDRLTGQVYLMMADREIIPSAQQISSDDVSGVSGFSTLQLSGSSLYSQLSGYIYMKPRHTCMNS